MTKKIMLFYIFILIVLFLTGCWDSRELNTLGIVLVIGIDREGDQVLLTAEVIEPMPAKTKSGMEKGTSVKYVQGIGDNIFQAFRNITLKFDRRIFISHSKAIIFGEEFAKKPLTNELDIFLRDNEQRETAYLLVAKGAKAYEVMGINAGIEDIPGNYILKLIENFKYNSKAVNINLAEYIKHYHEIGKQPVLGLIEKKEKKQIYKEQKTSKDKEYELSVIGSVAFYKDELVGYLSGEETTGFNFIRDKVEESIVTFPNPITSIDKYSTATPPIESEVGFKGTKKEDMSTIKIVKSKTKNDIEIRDGDIILKTKITMRGTIGEMEGDIDISEKEGMKELERACSEQIRKEVEKVFIKAQKDFKSDIFGFGSLFHRKYPEEWNEIKDNWHNVFPDVDFQVEVETNAIRTGLINTPIKRIKGK